MVSMSSGQEVLLTSSRHPLIRIHPIPFVWSCSSEQCATRLLACRLLIDRCGGNIILSVCFKPLAPHTPHTPLYWLGGNQYIINKERKDLLWQEDSRNQSVSCEQPSCCQKSRVWGRVQMDESSKQTQPFSLKTAVLSSAKRINGTGLINSTWLLHTFPSNLSKLNTPFTFWEMPSLTFLKI